MSQTYSGNLDNTLFGNVSGHVAPGSMFIMLGVWWLYNVVQNAVSDIKDQRCSLPSRVWYEAPNLCRRCRFLSHFGISLEPAVKILLGLSGVFIEISGAHWTLFSSETKDFLPDSINNFSHATMYSFFVLSGVTDIILCKGLIRDTHLSKLGHVVLGFAFFVEGFLFFFHLDGRSDLDSHAHSLIYNLCFLISLILILETTFTSPLLGLARCFCTILQGTWFYQVAFMLHGPNPWSQKSKASAMFVPIAFSWHCFVILLAIIISLVIGQRVVISRCTSNSDRLSMECLLTVEGESNMSTPTEVGELSPV